MNIKKLLFISFIGLSVYSCNGSDAHKRFGESSPHPLFKAMRDNNIEILRVLLNLDINVNTENAHGNTALQIAVSRAPNLDLTRLPPNHFANINFNIIQLLLKHGANPNTAFLTAVKNDHAGMVQLLLSHGANINECCGRYSPLYSATCDMVKLLLSRGADVDYCDYLYNTALIQAVQRNHLNTARVLLDYGANIDLQTPRFKETAIMHALYNVDMVKLLLDYTPDVDLKDSKGNTAFGRALKNHNEDKEDKIKKEIADMFRFYKDIYKPNIAQIRIDLTQQAIIDLTPLDPNTPCIIAQYSNSTRFSDVWDNKELVASFTKQYGKQQQETSLRNDCIIL